LESSKVVILLTREKLDMNITIDEKLLAEILKRTDSKNVQEIVEAALKAYLRKIKLTELSNLRGKITWEGNLNEMREC
jgi:Arc/MetJ family transcription regulator